MELIVQLDRSLPKDVHLDLTVLPRFLPQLHAHLGSIVLEEQSTTSNVQMGPTAPLTPHLLFFAQEAPLAQEVLTTATLQ